MPNTTHLQTPTTYFILLMLFILISPTLALDSQADFLIKKDHKIAMTKPTPNQNGRLLQGTNPRGFSIKGEFFNYDQKTNAITSAPGSKPYYQTLFSIAANYFQKTLTVTSGLFLQADSLYPQDQTTCQSITVPASYVNNGFNVTLFDSVFFILIGDTTDIPYHTFSTPCGLVRWPTYGYLLINTLFYDTSTTKTGVYHMNLYRIIRSMMNSLGWGTDFISAGTEIFYTAYGQDTMLPSDGMLLDISINGQARTMIVTPAVQAYVKSYFGCTQNLGVLIEDDQNAAEIIDSGVTVIEQSVFYDEVMASYPIANSEFMTGYKITPLALTLLRDTGYYQNVNLNMAQPAFFGKNAGCNFVRDTINSTTNPNQYCAPSTNQRCDFYGFESTLCQSSNTRQRTSSFLRMTSAPLICTTPQLRNPSPSTPQVVSSRSRCFDGVTNAGGNCYQADCIPTGIRIFINSQDGVCQPGNTTITIAGVQINCPTNQNVFCSRKNCDDWCNAQGLCINGMCTNCMQIDVQCSSCNANNCLKCMRGFIPSSDQKTCQTCSTLIPNCVLCSRNPTTQTPICTYCTNSTFLNSNQSSCVSCQTLIPNCQSCNIGTSITCSQCVNSSFTLAANGLSCVSNTVPATCNMTNCVQCTGSGSSLLCSQCTSGYFLDNTKYLQSSSNPACYLCSSSILNCNTCTGTSSVVCLTCNSNFFISADQKKCDTCSNILVGCSSCNTVSAVTTCTACNSGLYLKSTTVCQSCSTPLANCGTCNSSTQCTSCNSGFFMGPNKNCLTCTNLIPSCASCETISAATKCRDCGTTLFTNSNRDSCVACGNAIANCKTCTNNAGVTKCSQCNSGFAASTDGLSCLQSAFATIACPTTLSNCAQCSSNGAQTICTQCSNGFFAPNNKTCTPCSAPISGCNSCWVSTSGVSCSSCNTGLFPSADNKKCDSCTNILPSCTNCTVTNGVTSCSSVCTRANCDSCTVMQGVATCTKCSPSYYWQSSTSTCQPCMVKSTQCSNCQSTNNSISCSVCVSNTFLSANKLFCSTCQDVILNCQTCSSNNGGTICTQCASGYTLVNNGNQCKTCNSIINQCATCLLNAGKYVCSACNVGYAPNMPQSKCRPCSTITNCNKCTSLNKCTECSINLFPDETGSSCTTCSNIFPKCTTCSLSNSKTICIACANNLFPSLLGNSCATCSQTINNCNSCLVVNGGTTCQTCNSGLTVSATKTSCT